MDEVIEIIEREVEWERREQSKRRDSYGNKALLIATAQTIVLNVAINICLVGENSDDGRFGVIVSLAAIGIACVIYPVLAPGVEYDAPNIEGLLDEYDKIGNSGFGRTLKLRRKIVKAKVKVVLKNEKQEKYGMIFIGVSFLCLLAELMIILLKYIV